MATTSDEFRQTTRPKESLFGMCGCFCFLLIPLDSKYFQILVEEGLEETPWLFWGTIIVGGWGVVGFAWQLVRPRLILAADAHGVTVGPVLTLRIGRSPKTVRTVPCYQVVSIEIAEVIYQEGTRKWPTSQPALRIEFHDSIDMSHCDDMLAIQSGTRSYFAAKTKKYSESRAARSINYLSWKEPQISPRNENILVIGKRHFSKDLDLVCRQLQDMMDYFSQQNSTGKP